MAKVSSYIIPVLFADLNDDHGMIFDTGHAGFMLADSSGQATYFEYGPGGTSSWNQIGGSEVFSSSNSSLRKFKVHGDIGFDSNGDPTQASIEAALGKITSNLYSGSDPGMIFATPVAISQRQFDLASGYVNKIIRQITTNGDPYSPSHNNCLNFLYNTADASGVTVSETQHWPGVAWPAQDARSFLDESVRGFEYESAGSWQGQSILEVTSKNYETKRFLEDQLVQAFHALINDALDFAKIGSKSIGHMIGDGHAATDSLDKEIVNFNGLAHDVRVAGRKSLGSFGDIFASVERPGQLGSAGITHEFAALQGEVGSASSKEGGAVARALTRSFTFGGAGESLTDDAVARTFYPGSPNGLQGGEDRTMRGDNGALGPKDRPRVADLHGSKAANAIAGELETEGDERSADWVAPKKLFQHGVLQQKLEELGVIPGPSKVSGDIHFNAGNLGGGVRANGELPPPLDFREVSTGVGRHDDLAAALNRLIDRPKIYSGGPEVSVGPSSQRRSNSLLDGRDRADADIGMPALANNGRAAGASPGWFAALTGALAAAARNDAMPGHLRNSVDATIGRQSLSAQSGTHGDMMNVKFAKSPASYQSHMPVGPTASMPSQSLPIPGQVLFSP